MKKSLLAALVAVCTIVATGASAQHRNRSEGMNADGQKPTTEEIARMRTQRMTEALSLDENQARTVYDQCLRVAQLQRQLAEARQENAANMKRLLNEEQYAKWQKMRKAHMRHGMEPKRMCEADAASCCETRSTTKRECTKKHRAERLSQSDR